MIKVKICGIATPDALSAVVAAGAHYAGLNFYPPSPRYVTPDVAYELSRMAPAALKMVGLFVNPDDDGLAQVLARVPLDMIQLHGDETPARVLEIQSRHRLPVIKAVAVAAPADLLAARAYETAADYLLFDTKVTGSAAGGTGLSFDWRILAGQKFSVPWFLAGGLRADNVAEAIRVSGALHVDCASGVETQPGVKDAGLIERFMVSIK